MNNKIPSAFCQILAVLAITVCIQSIEARQQTYHRDQVLQVTPRTEKDIKFLNSLLHSENNLTLDFWTYPSKPSDPVDIHVPRRKLREFKHILAKRSIPFTVKIRNVQRQIKVEGMRPRSVSFNGAFRSYAQIVHEMKRLARLNESLVKVFSLGKTYENRTMYGIKLVLKYSSEESIRLLVDRLEWIIVPVVNVDGYIYTHKEDRLWRKNRRPNGNSTKCIGTDLNRNFNFRWATVGADYGKPCSDIYPGERPFSEPETHNLATYMYSIRDRIKAYVDFHSYGQLWMSPWGFKKDFPPTYRTMNRNAMIRIVLAIYMTNRTLYGFGPAAVVIYKTSGDATDWVYAVLGVTHSYGVELQPSIFSQNGFVLPPSYIEPVGKEVLAGMKTLASLVR
ncbi:hypothetical protein pdam_00001433 [Pocillopora damicornis]|uniref:Peptidase M14 domain-containing protein n=1 Tax=Pocillopora damicornis TaxID=46731 RepID=A0A3M6V3L9_POCDA|nr:hypothetical protein pdam_00001433 [Pocillopora damicornis]